MDSAPRREPLEPITLGIQGEDIAVGLRVTQVEPDSLAARAGLESGDVLVNVNGQKVDSVRAVQALLAQNRGGENIVLESLKAPSLISKKVTFGEWE